MASEFGSPPPPQSASKSAWIVRGHLEVSATVARQRNLLNTAVKRLRMREFLSELSFEFVQRLRKSISLSAFIKL